METKGTVSKFILSAPMDGAVPFSIKHGIAQTHLKFCMVKCQIQLHRKI